MKIAFIFILASLSFVSCHREDTKVTNDVELGKFIYRDDDYIHHISSKCIKLRHGKDENGHEIYAKHLIDTAQFVIVNPEYFRVCSRCVSDKQYENILRISDRNSQE